METTTLTPAYELVLRNDMHFPNESAEYRTARNVLLAEEIELRRHIERVAEMRRALPPGGAVPKNYLFIGVHGPITFEQLFADKTTLVAYSFMFGPQRKEACPMCSSMLASWNGEALDIQQNVALAVIARSPIERLTAFAAERGWTNLPLYCDPDGEYSRDYFGVTPEGSDIPEINVFTRRDGTIRHFWSGEMGPETADPGQDPRGAPDLMPIWTVLDNTPEGRRPDWYPSLNY